MHHASGRLLAESYTQWDVLKEDFVALIALKLC